MASEDSNTQSRINELIAELSECRNDERDAQNQILQVLTVAGTILGILLGASFFGGAEIDNSTARIIFFLSIFVFCTAFLYILPLGIKNVLRYHYIRNLEDRLHILVQNASDDLEMGQFLHWNTFSGPIITRNPRHIASSHALIYFISYSVATLFAGVFSILLVVAQFLRIKDRQWYDLGGIAFAIAVMIMVLILFLYTSRSAEASAQFSYQTAAKNLKIRLGGSSHTEYSDARQFLNFVRYLLYPKTKDPQKPALIVGGFLGGLCFTGNPISIPGICNLILVLFVFDFLAYQARYQINDLRGIGEDRGRLVAPLDDDESIKHKVRISLIIAFVRIGLAVVITLAAGGMIRGILGASLFLLLIFTVLYEAVRARGASSAVFFLVGSGYPLRFLLGFLTAFPNWTAAMDVSLPVYFFLAVALWSYGSCASILAWTKEVVEELAKRAKSGETVEHYRFEKEHFNVIHNLLKGRLKFSSAFPLRERGSLSDPWNLTYLVALACIGIVKLRFASDAAPLYVWLELFTIVCLITPIFLRYIYRIPFFAGGIGGIIAGLCVVWRQLSNPWWYLFLCLIQLLFAVTYFVFRYQVELKSVDLRTIIISFLTLLIGSDAVRRAFPQKTTTSPKE